MQHWSSCLVMLHLVSLIPLLIVVALFIVACQAITNFLRLQRVQNAAVQIVCPALRRKHHSIDILKYLHCYLYMAELITRLPFSATKLSNCNNLRILLHYSCYLVYDFNNDNNRHLRVLRSSTSDSQTYCQHSLHRQTLLLVGSHAALPPPPLFPHLYALLIVSLVLGLSSRPTRSQDICSRSAVRASDTLTRSVACHKFVTYLNVLMR